MPNISPEQKIINRVDGRWRPLVQYLWDNRHQVDSGWDRKFVSLINRFASAENAADHYSREIHGE